MVFDDKFRRVWIESVVENGLRDILDGDEDLEIEATELPTAVEHLALYIESAIHNADLELVKVGEIPPWMKFVKSMDTTHDDGSGWNEHVYRLKGEGDS